MSLLLAMIIGVVVGMAGDRLFPRGMDYTLFNVLAGVIGAILGLAVYVFSIRGAGDTLFSVGGTISTLLGAVLVEMLFVAVLSLPKKKKVEQEKE